MARLEDALRRHFGHPSFRPGQERLVRAVLGGRDALGILPTGGGKSVTYLLPAAVRPGLVLVVSPLVSLMTDQVARARAAGIPAAALHAGLSSAERRRVARDARAGDLRVLFLAPERLGTPAFVRWMAGAPVRLLAVDEAHCVVHWGFDFRPAYLEVAGLGARLGVPTLALTATATPPVRRELETLLGLVRPVRHVASFDRPNLFWSVERVRDRAQRWRRLVRWTAPGPGSTLVYAGTRARVDALRAALARRGLDAEAYHAGLPAPDRDRAQTRFLRGDCRLVVATNAFGMGVDKADVRTVVHWSAPGSLEAYYQEAGRAGRDGAPARVVVFVGPGDGGLGRRFVDQAHPPPLRLARVARRWARLRRRNPHGDASDALRAAVPRRDDLAAWQRALERYGADPARPGLLPLAPRWWPEARARRRAALARLEAVRRWVTTRSCRRAALLRYFGERAPEGPCGGCDRCRAL